MVSVMLLSKVGPEIVPTVYGRSLEEHKREEDPKGDYMGSQHDAWDDDGEDVGDDVLKRVCVLRSESARGREAMVGLMDVRVETAVVEEAVGVVEQGLANNKRDKNVTQEVEPPRRLWR